MELILSRPTGSRVVQDYLSGGVSSGAFFSGHYASLASFVAKAEEVDRRFGRAERLRATECITAPEGAARDRLTAFVEQGGYMVTTGQQPGLYGGPLYSIHKGLTAVRLAEALEARLEKPVIPVFWVASDDHDWEEANHTYLIGVDNALHRFELRSPDPAVTPSLHRITLGDDADEVLDRFVGHLPDTDFSARYVALLREGFASGQTMPAGFHRLLQALLGPFGLFFTDAADPKVKEHSSAMLLEELGRAEGLEQVLETTAGRLENAGFELQVPIMDGGVNLFLEGAAGRERLYRDGDDFRLRASGEVLSAAAIRSAVESDPKRLSPNVLFRPVVESALLPTLSYVGGPGEIAYFAQLRDYFEAHGIGMPVIHPRWSVTMIEGKIRKVLDKFGLDLADLDRPFHEVASGFAADEVPNEVKAAIGTLRGAVGSGVAELQKAVVGVDPTLKGPTQHLRSQTFTAIEDVEKKVMQAVKKESEIALQQLEKAQLHLYPEGKPAERIQSPLYFLARYDGEILEKLYQRFEVNLG